MAGRTAIVTLLALLVVLVGVVIGERIFTRGQRAFTAPSPSDREQAIGSTKGLDRKLARALQPDDSFEPIRQPGPSDWLARHPEKGQSYRAFMASRPNFPRGRRRVIYFQPLGDFAAGESPSLDKLKQFAETFFALEVNVLKPVPIGRLRAKSRTNSLTRKPQLLTRDVLEWLKEHLPADAYCIVGITMMDLYPDEDWNFVFGQASLSGRVGVYSFARYDPRFFGDEAGEDVAAILLHRSCKVLAHETGHMFGMQHCIFYECLMNGANHLREFDSRPMHLCPVCLRKLQYSAGFRVDARYERLRNFHRDQGFNGEAEWLDRRLESLQTN